MKQLNAHKRNILKLFNETSRENLDNGMIWYECAYDYALEVACEFNLELAIVVGVMAALSPNNKWERNKIDTRKFLSNPSLETKVCTFMNQRQKALDIYHSSGKAKDITKILNGIKTCNFFSNILYFSHSEAVTVDMWAFRSVKVEPKTKNIKAVTRAYMEVAKDLNIKPHQLQAVVWGVIRGSLV